ncbi:hypothetical protein E4U60_005743 [Claviceps pazoutovae]|uniref:2EXR domain-containing protein n=1 Tax=Claviceps pazoutovae TaxID=1649127 RepID=A0A9P7M7E7_9HYPO|nr:hypothetical protein E4U60_005743 [Claviceps pazoutovae]
MTAIQRSTSEQDGPTGYKRTIEEKRGGKEKPPLFELGGRYMHPNYRSGIRSKTGDYDEFAALCLGLIRRQLLLTREYNDISSADDGSLRSPRTCPRLIDDNEVEDPGEQPSSGDGVRNRLATRSAFPRFMQLPPELRHQIWHFYCPDLSVKARVLGFTFQESEPPPDGSDDYDTDFLTTSFTLASQTKSLRAMLSTHRESRSIAVRIFPDELALDVGSRRAVVRFRKETDVVFLWLDVNYIPPNFATQVQNLAIDAVQENYEENTYYDETLWPVVPAVKGILPNLKRLYSLWPVVVCGTKTLGNWCVTEYFERESCFRAYDRMKWLYLNPHLANESDDQDSSNSHDDYGTDSDESESEGIDDDEIIELDG